MSDLNQAVETLLQAGKNLSHVTVAVTPIVDAASSPPALAMLNVPDGINSSDVTEKLLVRLPKPQRRKGNLKMLSPDSLVDFVNRFSEESRTVLFADTNQRSVVAVMNYHEPTMEVIRTKDSDGVETIEKTAIDASPQWGDFKASYSFPLSRQWTVWKGIDNELQGQADLAQFFEDHIRDIADPATTPISESLQLMIDRLNLRLGTPAKILETARGMEVRSTEKVRQAVNTDTGEQVIVYEQEHASGGNATVTELRVPTAFLLAIPVFQNDAPYLLLCRLRYRKVGGGVQWLVNIQGADASLENAFARGCNKIFDGTGAPLFYSAEPLTTSP